MRPFGLALTGRYQEPDDRVIVRSLFGCVPNCPQLVGCENAGAALTLTPFHALAGGAVQEVLRDAPVEKGRVRTQALQAGTWAEAAEDCSDLVRGNVGDF